MKKVKIKEIFKRFNFVDYLLAIVFLFICLAFYLIFFRRSSYTTIALKVTERNILYLNNSPPYWYVDYLQKGIQEKDGLGRVTAELIDIYSYDSNLDKKAAYLTIKLKTVYSRRNNENKYKGTTIAVGEGLRINFQNLLVEGIVTKVEGMKIEYPEKELIVKTGLFYEYNAFREIEGVKPFLAEAIKVGDTVKDSKGTIVAKLIEKKVLPAKRYTFDYQGNVFQKNDPQFVDLLLVFKIKTKEVNGRSFFLDDNPVLINSVLPIHFQQVDLYPTIVSFEPSGLPN